MSMQKTPFMIDPSLYKQAGIDLKSGLPIRAVEGTNLKASMKKVMRLIDEQDAVNRYKWYNLPTNISSILSPFLMLFIINLDLNYIKNIITDVSIITSFLL